MQEIADEKKRDFLGGDGGSSCPVELFGFWLSLQNQVSGARRSASEGTAQPAAEAHLDASCIQIMRRKSERIVSAHLIQPGVRNRKPVADKFARLIVYERAALGLACSPDK